MVPADWCRCHTALLGAARDEAQVGLQPLAAPAHRRVAFHRFREERLRLEPVAARQPLQWLRSHLGLRARQRQPQHHHVPEPGSYALMRGGLGGLGSLGVLGFVARRRARTVPRGQASGKPATAHELQVRRRRRASAPTTPSPASINA